MPAKKEQLEELEQMEAVFQTGLELCHRLRIKLGVVSTSSSARKGLNQQQVARLIIGRKKTTLKRA